MPASGAKSPNGKRGYQRGKYTFSGSSNDKTTATAVKAIVPEPSTGGNKRKSPAMMQSAVDAKALQSQ